LTTKTKGQGVKVSTGSKTEKSKKKKRQEQCRIAKFNGDKCKNKIGTAGSVLSDEGRKGGTVAGSVARQTSDATHE